LTNENERITSFKKLLSWKHQFADMKTLLYLLPSYLYGASLYKHSEYSYLFCCDAP